MKRKLMGLLCFALVASSLFSFNQSTAYANDDITGITLETEMRALIDLGVLYGDGKGKYSPFQEINRGQFAAFISRALQLPEGTPRFPDVPLTAALAGEINSASEAGIINGYGDGTFGMNDPITRDQMALMIDKALVYLNVERNEASLSFTDVSDIGQTFRQAVSHTVYDKIVFGYTYEDGTSQFLPKKTATRAEAAAFISRMIDTAIKYVEEGPGGEEETGAYKVATIDANKNLILGTTSYETYTEAKNAATNINQVVTLHDQIVSMSEGLVISRPTVGQYLTYIYEDQNFNKNITYIPAGQEMQYLDSTDEYVKVNIAGMTAYVKHTEVYLLPIQQVEGRNYYSVNGDGDLVHSIYNQVTKARAAYVMGKAPSFLTAGNQYYSWDGGVFYNTNGQEVGTAYQYFNYLPARTVSNYTAEELDQYIDHILAERESLYTSNPTLYVRYKDATELSKINDLGTYIKGAESKYKINALLILAMAMHESDFGMSSLSQERNNLFGLKAYDSNLTGAEKFVDPSESIDGLATRYLNVNYINPLGSYANGAAIGNKSRGFNVKYASDPYWGQKIAGHMYRVDKFLSGKDFDKYRIGETNTTDLNVRHEPEVTSQTLQFTYKKAGMPVVIVDSTTNSKSQVWYKILSDHNDYQNAYVRSDYVNDMKIAK